MHYLFVLKIVLRKNSKTHFFVGFKPYPIVSSTAFQFPQSLDITVFLWHMRIQLSTEGHGLKSCRGLSGSSVLYARAGSSPASRTIVYP